MITFFKTTEKRKKGFTLLFAVLVSSLIISISATVISIALRQTIISSTGRESQYAFYAANTVMECAFYWDVVGVNGVSESVFLSPGETSSGTIVDSAVTCAGGAIKTGTGFSSDFANTAWSSNAPQGTNSNTVTTFYIEVTDITNSSPHNSYCAQATVTKERLTGANEGVIETTIEAKGYNTCDLNSPRAVERGLIQSYQS